MGGASVTQALGTAGREPDTEPERARACSVRGLKRQPRSGESVPRYATPAERRLLSRALGGDGFFIPGFFPPRSLYNRNSWKALQPLKIEQYRITTLNTRCKRLRYIPAASSYETTAPCCVIKREANVRSAGSGLQPLHRTGAAHSAAEPNAVTIDTALSFSPHTTWQSALPRSQRRQIQPLAQPGGSEEHDPSFHVQTRDKAAIQRGETAGPSHSLL